MNIRCCLQFTGVFHVFYELKDGPLYNIMWIPVSPRLSPYCSNAVNMLWVLINMCIRNI